MGMESRRWVNPAQPQTLHIVTILFYIDAVFALLGGGLASALGVILLAGSVAAGFGIANEFKWGYWIGVAIAVLGLLPYALLVLGGHIGLLFGARVLIGLGLAIARFVLLMHPMSQSYVKTWFK